MLLRTRAQLCISSIRYLSIPVYAKLLAASSIVSSAQQVGKPGTLDRAQSLLCSLVGYSVHVQKNAAVLRIYAG